MAATKKPGSRAATRSSKTASRAASEPGPIIPLPVAEDAPSPSELPDKIEEGQRSGFGSRIGFILAAVGSAVGFGSIARFPMNASNGGGAAFLLMYLGIMVLIGIPMMVAEFSLGRSAQKNTVGAFRVLTGDPKTRWRWAGFMYFILAAFVLSYYGILTGWTVRFLLGSFNGAYFDDPDSFVARTVEGPIALMWFAIVMIFVCITLFGRISKGIEKVNLVMMPTLYLIIIGLAIYAATLAGAGPGYSYYLKPDFREFTLPVFTIAVGQAFFSLSLAQGAMMTYSSYIPKTSSLASNAGIISISTLIFAIMCGFMIFPMLAAFGRLDPDTPAGFDLIFGPLAETFAAMGTPTGNIVGVAFFTATFFAAFTSAVSLVEPSIAYFVEEHGLDRKRAAILTCGSIYILGIAVSLSGDLLNLEAGALTDAAIMLGGLLIALYVGWFSPAAIAIARMDESDAGLRIGRIARPMMRYVMPVILLVLLFFQVAGFPCALTDGEAKPGLIEQFVAFFGGNTQILGCTGA